MSAAHPTADSHPRAAMLSSAPQLASTITSASLALGPPTPPCSLEPGTVSENFTHVLAFVDERHKYYCMYFKGAEECPKPLKEQV